MKALLLFLSVITALFVTVPQTRAAEPQMCCPEGYKSSVWACMTANINDICCSRDWFKVTTVPKVACTEVFTSSYMEDICDNASNVTACKDCLTKDGGAYTAIGCLPVESPGDLMQMLFSLGIGIAGGLAFLLIILGGFQMMTAAGNPEQMNAGRELIGSAISGLILIIFSVFLLKLIGYDILRIPGIG